MESIINVLAVLGAVLATVITRVAFVALGAAILAIPVIAVVHLVRALAQVRERALGVVHAGGLAWSSDAYYAPGHTWVRPLPTDKVRVGVDDLARRILTGASRMRLMRPGDLVREGGVAAIVECGDRRGEIRSPVDGVVVSVNRAIERDPSLIHREPYMRGWLYTVAPSNKGYVGLLHGHDALAWLSREKDRLAHFFEGAVGIAAADGGDLVAPPPTLLTDEQWAELTEAFLAGERVRT